MFKKIIGHFCTITHHKWLVFKLCVRAGIPWRGFMHDWSKYSPTEFWESVKYYTGKRSPIYYCKQENGYSKAWLHHKGRNKHHYEYWYDYAAPEQTPVISYEYTVEMICDTLAAGMVYRGKEWTNSSQKEYWERTKQLAKLNPKIYKLLTEVYDEVAKKGIKEVINKKKLKKVYKRYVR
jgi:hypothetical protein